MDSIAVISDIHGNSLALRAVLADIDARGMGSIYCLGDLVGYGPDPNGVVDLIRAKNIPTVLGNYDDGVGWERGGCGCHYATAEAERLGEASYAFTAAEVTAQRKAYLRGLPSEFRVRLADKRLHLVHGSPRRINEYLLRDRPEQTYLRLAKVEEDDALVFGHTHLPWSRMIGGVFFVNVGSVGRPKDGDPRAMYTVLRTQPGGAVDAEVLRVPYDAEAAARAVLAAGLPAGLAEGLLLGT